MVALPFRDWRRALRRLSLRVIHRRPENVKIALPAVRTISSTSTSCRFAPEDRVRVRVRCVRAGVQQPAAAAGSCG